MAADKRNRKQRKELARQLQSANPGLDVVHPRAAGIDVGNDSSFDPVGETLKPIAAGPSLVHFPERGARRWRPTRGIESRGKS